MLNLHTIALQVGTLFSSLFKILNMVLKPNLDFLQHGASLAHLKLGYLALQCLIFQSPQLLLKIFFLRLLLTIRKPLHTHTHTMYVSVFVHVYFVHSLL